MRRSSNGILWSWLTARSAAARTPPRRRASRRLSYEEVEARLCLTDVSFVTHEIASGAAGSVYAADLDGDDDMDVLAASQGNISWYANTDGKGTFGLPQTVDTASGPLRTGDLDGDGDLDILAAGTNVRWYQNIDGTGTFGSANVIQSSGSVLAYATDVDGDGDLDVLSESNRRESGGLNWHENADGEGNCGAPKQKFGDESCCWGNVLGLDVADLDNDGDVDVISGLNGWDTGSLNWYSNDMGSFGLRQEVRRAGLPIDSVEAADVDRDGDIDVLATFAAFGGGEGIHWYENSGSPDGGDPACRWALCGPGRFLGPHVVAAAGAGPLVYAADLDNDGDVDVITSSPEHRDNNTTWYENRDGRGAFSGPNVISSSASSSLYAADIDADGDMDVLSAARTGLAWHENTAISATEPLTITATADRTAMTAGQSVTYTVEVSNPGEAEVIVATFRDTFPEQVENVLWRCEASAGSHCAGIGFGDISDTISLSAGGKVTYTATGTLSTSAIGQISNVASVVHPVTGVESRATDTDTVLAAGDANGDLSFDQLDIVQVLQAAKYLTGAPATWEQGDWNGDGVFDQLDIIAALQAGNYMVGPRAGLDDDGVEA